jgi:hypothetical protein
MEFGQNGEYSQISSSPSRQNPDTIRENNLVLYSQPDTIRENKLVLYSQVIMGLFQKISLSAFVNMAGFFFYERPVKVFKMNSSKFSLSSAAALCRLLLVGIMSDEQIGNLLNCVMQRVRVESLN